MRRPLFSFHSTFCPKPRFSSYLESRKMCMCSCADNSKYINYSTLRRQDDVTSGAVISLLSDRKSFKKLSLAEGQNIKKRDKEDDSKLSIGIKISIDRGIIPADPEVAPAQIIDVMGLTAEQVAQKIIDSLPTKSRNVLIIQGLSGTGKGTTVNKLQSLLPNCVTWSNGNVFRSLTHIISEETKTKEWSPSLVTPEAVEKAMKRLSYEKFDDGFDVVIDKITRVSEIQNTKLKTLTISSRVPTVAEQSQGEVIKFAAAAVEKIKSYGYNVILEGRAQTLNYIPSENRFELIIADTEVLGQRRAAQRIMATAFEKTIEDSSPSKVTGAVIDACDILADRPM